MKTIQFIGTKFQLHQLRIALGVDNPNHPKEVEPRVYVLDASDERYEPTMTDANFMDLAEEDGRVYSLDGFKDAFNEEEINSAIDVIRIINVELFG